MAGYSLLIVGVIIFICGLMLGIAAPHIKDVGITSAMPQITVTPTPYQNMEGTMPHLVTFHIYPEQENQLVMIDLQGHVQDYGYTDNHSEVTFPMERTELYNATLTNCTLKIIPYDENYRMWCRHV